MIAIVCQDEEVDECLYVNGKRVTEAFEVTVHACDIPNGEIKYLLLSVPNQVAGSEQALCWPDNLFLRVLKIDNVYFVLFSTEKVKFATYSEIKSRLRDTKRDLFEDSFWEVDEETALKIQSTIGEI